MKNMKVWSKLIPYQQMIKNVEDARIVITHGGPASFIMPLQIGKTPIAEYAKKKKLKIYAIGGIQKCADQFVDCSPFEVLAYFRNAEEVITDTFHGSIFSIITHRPFTTLIRKSVGNSYGNEEKLSDLLKRLELNTRMTTKIESVENINEQVINYEKIDEILKTHRKVARQYLQKNLEG